MLILNQLRQLEKLQAQGDHSQLLALCDQILTGQPGLGPVWYQRGASLFQLGDPELAAHSFDQAARCGGEITALARFARATCLRQIMRPLEALEELGHLPVDPANQVLRIQAHLQADQAAAALDLLNNYDNPPTELIEWLRVEALARCGRYEEAIRALDACPATPVTQHLRARLKQTFAPGHAGLVDLACKLADGLDAALLDQLNQPLAVHVQSHLGLLQDVRPGLLVMQPNLRFRGIRLVTLGLTPTTELVLSLSQEEPWAAPLLFGLSRHPLRQGQIIANSPKLCPECPYGGFLLYPSISVPPTFHHCGQVSFLAVYPLYREELTVPLQVLLQRWEMQGVGDLLVSGRVNCG